MLNLNQNQLDWVCQHLSHTSKVHKTHYRQMSGMLERVYVSKLLLIQDLNLTSKYKGQDLENLDIREIVMPESVGSTPVTMEEPEIATTTGDLGEREEADVHNALDMSELEEENVAFGGDSSDSSKASEYCSDVDEPVMKKRRVQHKRQRWSQEEEKELRLHFDTYLQSGIVPRIPACEKAKRKSKQNGGQIHKRESHLIIKKISAMNHKKK